MTWSIVVRDLETGALGIGVATRFVAAGGLWPPLASGVGAVPPQATITPTYGPRGVALMRAGAPAADAVRVLIESDPGRHVRQVHMVDAAGRSAAHTGPECIEWSGHRTG